MKVGICLYRSVISHLLGLTVDKVSCWINHQAACAKLIERSQMKNPSTSLV